MKAYWLVALLALCSVATADGAWATWTSKPGRISATMPGTPKESASGENHIAATETPSGKVVVMWADQPAGTETPKQLLDATQSGLAGEGKVISSKDLTYRGLPARDVEMVSNDSKIAATFRIILKDRRIYIALSTDREPDHMKRFFDSVRIH